MADRHHRALDELYACVIKDVFFNRIVSYSLDARMKLFLAVDVLRAAVARRSPALGLIAHSDRGSELLSPARLSTDDGVGT